MNKKLVDSLLPSAEQAIIDQKIADADRNISENFRSQVSSFGAAITTGSLLAAVAFFSDQGSADTDRPKILKAICQMLRKNNLMQVKTVTVDRNTEDSLFETVKVIGTNAADIQLAKEKVLACSVALKLAMNLFRLKPDDKKGKKADKQAAKSTEDTADES